MKMEYWTLAGATNMQTIQNNMQQVLFLSGWFHNWFLCKKHKKNENKQETDIRIMSEKYFWLVLELIGWPNEIANSKFKYNNRKIIGMLQ